MECIKVFSTELMKLKRTKALWLALLAPCFVSSLSFLRILVQPDRPVTWLLYFAGNTTFWLLLMLPLYVGVETGLLASIEHTANTWKSLFVLPISRTTMYLTKLVIAILLILLSNVIFIASTIGTGLLLSVLRPQSGITTQLPNLSIFLESIYFSFIASLLMISIQFWISIRTKNFVTPIMFSILAVVGNIMAQNYIPFKQFSPWILPHEVLNTIASQSGIMDIGRSAEPTQTLTEIVLKSLIGAIIVVGLMLWEGEKRDSIS